MRSALVCSMLFGLCLAPARAASPDELARTALDVLRANCYRCHGQDGNHEGGLGAILDPAVLRDRKLIVPGHANESKLIRRIVKGQMPPADESPRPTASDIEALKKWIDAGAPGSTVAYASGSAASDTELYALILTDLEHLPHRARRFQRYFTLAPLARAGAGESTLNSYRVGLKKLVNSLSWHPRVADLHSVGPAGLVLRVDLRDLLWDHNLWNRLLAEYPYGIIDDSGAFRAVAANAFTRLPVVRADWLLATASRPPLYYDLLQLPTTAGELERQLRIDAAADIQQERVARAGFNGSGVARNNRLIERHVGPHGAYWRTYDFEAVPQNLVDRQNLLPDRRNLFAFPLGPGRTDGTFQHAGGEIIFHLPNGLLGFLLVDANDRRVDKAPTAIVSDPRRPDRAVEPGVSCLSCHVTGILPKADQVRAHVARNLAAFGRTDTELVNALYPPEPEMHKLMDQDAERFRRALEECGARVTDADPVSAAARRYEDDLDLRTAAAEAGVAPGVFRDRLTRSEALTRNLGALRVEGGTVHRPVYQQAFADLVRELRLGTLAQASLIAGSLPDNTGELDPLEGPSSQTNAAAVSPDHRFVLLGSADRSVRLVEVASGREVRRFLGHAASVWAVAFSPDGKQALSGSLDGTVRLWDVGTGQELRRMDVHTGLVSGVAFSPDGKSACTVGFDHTVILWDLASGRPHRRLDGWPSVLHSVAIDAAGLRAAVGGDSWVALIDLVSGDSVRRFAGHTAGVVALTFSPDGQLLASASDDGTVRIWDLRDGREVHMLRGHARGARALSFTPDGQRLLTGDGEGVIRRWEIASESDHEPTTSHAAAVAAIAVTPDGRQVLSVGRDSSLSDRGEASPSRPATSKESQTAPPAGTDLPRLRPIGTVALHGTLSGPLLSPDGRGLYVLDRTAGQLLRLDAATLRTTARTPVPEGAAFAVSRDGRDVLLAVAATRRGERSELQLLDPHSLRPRGKASLEAEPFDIAPGPGRLVFLSGGGTGWTDITAVDTEYGTAVARWGGVWARSRLSLTPDGKRLLTSSQGVTPSRVESLLIPEPLTERPTASAAPTGPGVGGVITVSPDSRFALCRAGAVLRLSNVRADDLQPVAEVGPSLAAVIDPDRLALLFREDGTLDRYSYPDWRPRARYRVGVIAFGATLDARAGRLYVAGIRTASLGDLARDRGVGDLLVFDVQALDGRPE